MRDDLDRLRDILDAAESAITFGSPTSRQHAGDDLVLSAVTHRLIVIGEAARTVSSKTRELLPDLPWHRMIGMRNYIVHAYWTVDATRVWGTVESDLPDLVTKLRQSLPATDD